MIRDNELNFVFQKSTVHANKRRKNRKKMREKKKRTLEREKYSLGLSNTHDTGIGGMRCRQQNATTYSDTKRKKKKTTKSFIFFPLCFFFRIDDDNKKNKFIYIIQSESLKPKALTHLRGQAIE